MWKRILLATAIFLMAATAANAVTVKHFLPPFTPGCTTIELFRELVKVAGTDDEGDFTVINYPHVFMVYDKAYVKVIDITHDGIAITEKVDTGRRICTWATRIVTEIKR